MPLRPMLIASVSLTFLSALLLSTTANAGCEITIEIKNDHDDMVTVNWWHSEVKIKNGFWKDLSKDLTGTKIQDSMEPGAVVSRVYGATSAATSNDNIASRSLRRNRATGSKRFRAIPISRRRRTSRYISSRDCGARAPRRVREGNAVMFGSSRTEHSYRE